MEEMPYFVVPVTNLLPDGTRHVGLFRPINGRGAEERIDLPHVFVELRFWDAGNERFTARTPCLWDSGSDVTLIGQDFANSLGITLPSRSQRIQGIGGNPRGWSIRHPIRFPYPGFENLWFPFCLYIVEGPGPELPLLGFRDIHRNFQTATRGEEQFFLLRAGDHEGRTIVDGQPAPADIR